MQLTSPHFTHVYSSYDLSCVMRKPAFASMLKQMHRSAAWLSTFAFATQIVQSLCFLNQKFQASNNLLWLYSSIVSGLVGNTEDMFSLDADHL